MRDLVKQVVNQFLTRQLPRDQEYYQQKKQDVIKLLEALEQSTGRNISWEPPVDMLNLFRLQIPVDSRLDIPISEITTDDLQELLIQGRSTSLLQLLISNFSRFTYMYWLRFVPPELEENISTEMNFQDLAEEQLFEQVQQKLEELDWLLLSPAEAAEPVPEAPPPWPFKEGLPLVRHIIFPGCTLMID